MDYSVHCLIPGIPVSFATSETSRFLISAIYPKTVNMTKPDIKLVIQFTVLVTIASLGAKKKKDLKVCMLIVVCLMFLNVTGIV